jgi:hypothetical protein
MSLRNLRGLERQHFPSFDTRMQEECRLSNELAKPYACARSDLESDTLQCAKRSEGLWRNYGGIMMYDLVRAKCYSVLGDQREGGIIMDNSMTVKCSSVLGYQRERGIMIHYLVRVQCHSVLGAG